MYIAGSFHTVRRSQCGCGREWIDNDPHFWTQPPTWGICRNDLRRRAQSGDYIFFVLPKAATHPQCIFAYMKLSEDKISHSSAFSRRNLRSKRMGNKMPNGNIIVGAKGGYNQFDDGAHRHKFDRIKEEYAIGDIANSRLLTEKYINTLAPDFVPMLQRVFSSQETTPIRIISRYGRTLSPAQVRLVLEWVEC